MEYCKDRENERKRQISELAGKSTNMTLSDIDCLKLKDLEILKKSFFTLEKLLKEEIQHDLDANLLCIYIEEGLIPRGLRSKFEAPFKNDPVFLMNWNDHLHKCGIGLLEMLKTKRVQLLDTLKTQIASLLADIKSRSTHPAHDNFDKILTNRVTTYEKDHYIRKSIKSTNSKEIDGTIKMVTSSSGKTTEKLHSTETT